MIKIDAKQADGDALLILQNVKFLGFENGNRFEGFDKNTTLKILEVIPLRFWIFPPSLNATPISQPTENGRYARTANRYKTFQTWTVQEDIPPVLQTGRYDLYWSKGSAKGDWAIII